jgi:uncharacterized protein YjbJ (UPF0337 family)
MSTRTKGNWDKVVGKLKERWGQLGEDELMEFEGDVQQLVGFIELRTTDARDDIVDYVNRAMGESEGTMQHAQRVAQDYAHRTGEAMSHAYENAQAGLYQGYEQAAETLRRRPIGSVAVAFGSGLVAGVLVALALRSK